MLGIFVEKKELRLALVSVVALVLVLYSGSHKRVEGEELAKSIKPEDQQVAGSSQTVSNLSEYRSADYGFSINYSTDLHLVEAGKLITINHEVKKGTKPVLMSGITMEILENNGIDIKTLALQEKASLEEKNKADNLKDKKHNDIEVTNVIPLVVSSKVGYSFEVHGEKNQAIVYLPLKDYRRLKIQFDLNVLEGRGPWEQMLNQVSIE